MIDDSPPERVEPGPRPKPSGKKKTKSDRAREGLSRRRPGIMMAALELGLAASEREPLTKERLYELLVEKFPDYPQPQSMKSTVRRFPNWAPYYYRVQLHRNPRGYWLTKDYEGPVERIPGSHSRPR